MDEIERHMVVNAYVEIVSFLVGGAMLGFLIGIGI